MKLRLSLLELGLFDSNYAPPYSRVGLLYIEKQHNKRVFI
nr:MAG TPA: hypothetical protein [Caudoviricetes sp.]